MVLVFDKNLYIWIIVYVVKAIGEEENEKNLNIQ